jgi:hypothetical protein
MRHKKDSASFEHDGLAGSHSRRHASFGRGISHLCRSRLSSSNNGAHGIPWFCPVSRVDYCKSVCHTPPISGRSYIISAYPQIRRIFSAKEATSKNKRFSRGIDIYRKEKQIHEAIFCGVLIGGYFAVVIVSTRIIFLGGSSSRNELADMRICGFTYSNDRLSHRRSHTYPP